MGPRGPVKPERKPARTQLVVLCGLLVVAAASVIRLLSSGPQSAPAATVATSAVTPAAPVAPTATALQPSNVTVSVTWPTVVARDPFHSELVFPPAPPEPKVEAPVDALPAPPPPQIDLAALAKEKIHLKGTVLGDRPLAMMNGRVYRVGEVVEGFTIVEIEKNQITIERDGSRLTVVVQ